MSIFKQMVLVGLLLFGNGWASLALAASDSASVPEHRIPWSGYWWPRSSGKLVMGYSQEPAPLKKYDAYAAGYYPGRATDAGMNVEYDPEALAWFGHCDDWAAAAILEPEPNRAGDLNGIPYNVGDKKGLLTLFTERNFSTVRYGRRYVNGTSDINDIHPGGVNGFHQTLINYIAIQGLPIVMDVDPGPAVWSYPAYRYSMEWHDTGSTRHVTCTVWMADDFVDPDFVGTKPYSETYTYALEIDDTGALLDKPGYWEGDSIDNHPDFMWFPTSSGTTHPYLERATLNEIIASQPSGSDDRFEENDDADSAHAIPALIEDRYYWGSAQDADWYRVAAQKGDDFYAFILSPADDIDVRIFDAQGNETGIAFYHAAKINAVSDSGYFYVRVLSDTMDGAFYNIAFFSSPSEVIPHVTTVDGWDTAMTLVGEEWYFDRSRINLFDADNALLTQNTVSVPDKEITRISVGEQFAQMADKAVVAKVLNLDAAQSPLGFFSYSNGPQLVNLPFRLAPATRLIAPDIRNAGKWGTGVALQNTDVIQRAEVKMIAHDRRGRTLSETSFTIGPGMNRVDLISGFGPVPAEAAWVEFLSDQRLQGIVLWATASSGADAGLAGIPLLRPQHLAETLYIPHLASSADWLTEIALVNPNSETATIDVTGYDSDGNLVGTTALTLSANGCWTGEATSLFDATGNPQIVWAKIRASETICGYQLYRRGEEGLAALPLTTGDDAREQLSVKYIPDAASSWTGLVLLNPDAGKADVWAAPLDAEGNNLLGDDYLWYKPPGGISGNTNVVGVVEHLFPGFPSGTVRLNIFSKKPIIGFGLYETIDAGQVDVLYLD